MVAFDEQVICLNYSAMPVQNQFLCVFSNFLFGMFDSLNSLGYT